MTRSLLGLLAPNLLYLLAGLGVTALLGRWSSGRELRSYLPVAYMAGVATVGIFVQLMLISGLSLSIPQIVVLCAILAAPALLRRPRESAPAVGGAPAARSQRVSQLALGSLLALLLVECALQALDTWDSFAIWTMKARAIVLLGGLKPEVFASHAYEAANLDYPPLLPGLQAIDFRFMGSPDARVIHVQSWLLLTGWLLASARLLRGRADPCVLWPALGLAAAAPATITLVQEGYADVPVAIFGGLAALAAWLYVVEPTRGAAGLLTVFAAASAATKRDAWSFAVLLFLVTLVVARRRRRPLAPLALGLGVVVAVVGSWLGWLASHGYTSHEDLPIAKSLRPSFLVGRVGRAGHAIVSIADYATRPSLWLIVVPLTVALIALAVRGPTRDVAAFVAALLALDYAALVWAFWISRENVEWHLAHAAPRVVATPVFVAATFVPLLVGRVRAADEPTAAP